MGGAGTDEVNAMAGAGTMTGGASRHRGWLCGGTSTGACTRLIEEEDLHSREADVELREDVTERVTVPLALVVGLSVENNDCRERKKKQTLTTIASYTPHAATPLIFRACPFI